jgi:hypothetical protein
MTCRSTKRLQLEPGPARAILARVAGHVVIRITERLGGGEPVRTAYAVAEPNQHRAIALFKLRPDHTADEQVEAVAEDGCRGPQHREGAAAERAPSGARHGCSSVARGPVTRCCRIGCSTIRMRVERPNKHCYVRLLL